MEVVYFKNFFNQKCLKSLSTIRSIDYIANMNNVRNEMHVNHSPLFFKIEALSSKITIILIVPY